MIIVYDYIDRFCNPERPVSDFAERFNKKISNVYRYIDSCDYYITKDELGNDVLVKKIAETVDLKGVRGDEV